MPVVDASPLIRLHASDNVLVVRQSLALGQALPGFGLRAKAQLPAGHKIAARDIAAGERVLKYNVAIGRAARDIEAGEHVHGHNLELVHEAHDPGFGLDVKPVTSCPKPIARASWASCARTAAWARATSSASSAR